MLANHHYELFPKRSFSVMLFLISNIGGGRFDSGNADAECAIAFLPTKGIQLRKCFVYPFRRIAFEELNCFGEGNWTGHRNQNVNVIRGSSYGERFHFVFPRNSAEIGPEAFAQGELLSSLTGLAGAYVTLDPASKRWAIIKRRMD